MKLQTMDVKATTDANTSNEKATRILREYEKITSK